MNLENLKICTWCGSNNINVEPYLVEDFPIADEFHDIETEALICKDCGYAIYCLDNKLIKEFSVKDKINETRMLKTDYEVKLKERVL